MELIKAAYFHICNSGVVQKLLKDGDQYYISIQLTSYGVEGPITTIPIIHRDQIKTFYEMFEIIDKDPEMLESWDKDGEVQDVTLEMK